MSEERTQSRRKAIQTLGGLVVAGLAGCQSAGSSESDETSTETETDTATEADAATESPTPEQTTTEEETTHEHTDAEPDESAQFVENPEEVHQTLVAETSVPSDEVLIGFRLEDSSLPFTTEVYHAPDDAEIHATKTYDTQDLSQVDLVPESPKALETVETEREDVHYGTTKIGEPLAVTLVARHDGETMDWSSWSRTGYPHGAEDEEDPDLKVDCYCGGMNYTAPSGGTWARVIQVTPTEQVDPGTTIALNWTSSRL